FEGSTPLSDDARSAEAGGAQPPESAGDHPPAAHVGGTVLPAARSDELQQVDRPDADPASRPGLRGRPDRPRQERVSGSVLDYFAAVAAGARSSVWVRTTPPFTT